MAKGPSGQGFVNNRGAPAPAAVEGPDWSDSESTQVDHSLGGRSDWARPRDGAALESVRQIEKMLEEVLVDVPVAPIEDHRAAAAAPAAPADVVPAAAGPPPKARSRALLFAIAGLVAVGTAVALLLQNDLLPRF